MSVEPLFEVKFAGKYCTIGLRESTVNETDESRQHLVIHLAVRVPDRQSYRTSQVRPARFSLKFFVLILFCFLDACDSLSRGLVCLLVGTTTSRVSQQAVGS